MIEIKVKAETPKGMFSSIRETFKSSPELFNEFSKRVLTSVDLSARNTENFKEKDLAMFQIKTILKDLGYSVV